MGDAGPTGPIHEEAAAELAGVGEHREDGSPDDLHGAACNVASSRVATSMWSPIVTPRSRIVLVPSTI